MTVIVYEDCAPIASISSNINKNACWWEYSIDHFTVIFNESRLNFYEKLKMRIEMKDTRSK